MSATILKKILEDLDGNIPLLVERFEQADPNKYGVIMPVRFLQTLRSAKVNVGIVEGDRLTTQYSAGPKVDYQMFLTELKSVAEQLEKAKKATQFKPTSVAVLIGQKEAVKEPKKPSQAEIEAERPRIPYDSALEQFRATEKTKSPRRLFWEFDEGHQGNLSLGDFVKGCRNVLKLEESKFPDTACEELFAHFGGNEHATLDVDQFNVLCVGVTEENAAEFRDRFYAWMMKRNTSLFENFNMMADPELHYTTPQSIRVFLERYFSSTPPELRKDFLLRLVDYREDARPSESIPFAKFVDVVRDAVVRQETGQTIETDSDKVSPVVAEPKTESPEEAEKKFQELRRLLLEAAGGSAARIKYGLSIAGEPINDGKDIGVKPVDLIGVFVNGMSCRLSLAQKDYLTSHCVDEFTGLISVGKFFDYFGFEKGHASTIVPRSVTENVVPVKTALVQSPVIAPRRRVAASDSKTNSAGVISSFVPSEEKPVIPPRDPTNVDDILSGRPVTPPPTCPRVRDSVDDAIEGKPLEPKKTRSVAPPGGRSGLAALIEWDV